MSVIKNMMGSDDWKSGNHIKKYEMVDSLKKSYKNQMEDTEWGKFETEFDNKLFSYNSEMKAGYRPVTDNAELKALHSKEINPAWTSNSLMAPVHGAVKGTSSYLSSFNDAIGNKKRAKEWKNNAIQSHKMSEDSPWLALGGEIVSDPINALPMGLVTKGGKLARAAKSGAIGTAAGYGTTNFKESGNPLNSQAQVDEASMYGGAGWGGINAAVSLLTKGKVNHVPKVPLRGEPTQESIKVAEGLTEAPTPKKSFAELRDIIDGKNRPPKVQPQYAKETPIPPQPTEPNFVMRPNNPPSVYQAPIRKVPSLEELKTIEAFAPQDKFGSSSQRIAKVQKGTASEQDFEWIDEVRKQIPEEQFNAKMNALQEQKKVAAQRKAEVEAPRDVEGNELFANGGNAFGGSLGGGTLGAMEAISDGEVTTEELLGKVGAGALGGRYLGKKFGGTAKGTGMFAGKKAVGFNDAKKAGKTFSDTADKQERFWIDDIGAEVKQGTWGTSEDIKRGNSTVGHLDELLEHEELFKKYPELKDISVRVVPDKSGASYDPTRKSIEVGYDTKTGKINKSNLLHEVQHAVQEKEGFARGGSPDAIKALDLRKTLTNHFGELPFYQRLDEDFLTGKITEDQYYSKSINTGAPSYGGLDKLKHDTYERLAGEQEARAVQAKLDHPELNPYEALAKKEGGIKKPIVKMDDGVAMSMESPLPPKTKAGETSIENGANKLIQKAVGGTVKAVYKAADHLAGGRIAEAWKAVKDSDTVDLLTGHKIYGKKDYMGMRENFVSNLNKNMVNSEALHRQLTNIDPDTSKSLYRYMTGEKDIKLHPSIKKFADEYQAKVDNKGQQLVDLGVLEQGQFDKFKGRYLHRRYTKDISKQTSGIFSKRTSIQGVHARGNAWQGSKADYEKLLKNDEIGDFFEGKIQAKELGNGKYEFSQDWTKEQRAKWGEVEDIAFSLPETLGRLDDMISNATLLKRVAKETGYVFDDIDEAARSGYTQLAGKKYGALQGKWVTRDVAHDIDEFAGQIFGRQDEVAHNARQALRTYISLWKASHTLYNPKAHMNNLVSNVTFQVMEGLNPANAIENARRGMIASYKTNKFKDLVAKKLVGLSDEETTALAGYAKDEDIKLYMQAEEAGLFGRSQLNDILFKYVNKTAPKKGFKSGLESGVQKIDDMAGALYQGEDNVMRFSLLKGLMEKKGMTFKEAISQVNKTIPDYSKPMSKGASFLRGSGITPFISWTYYSMPIMARQVKERPARGLAIMAGMYGLYESMGINPYDKKDIPQEGFSFKRIPIYKDGDEIMTLKVDKWLPHGELLNPLEFGRGFVNMGTWQPAMDLIQNHNTYFNRKITNKEGMDGAYQKAKFFTQDVLPSADVVGQIYNLAESKLMSKDRRRKNNVVQPRSTFQELLNLGGFNTLTYDKAELRKKVKGEEVRAKKKKR